MDTLRAELTNQQAAKFMEGYNRHVNDWNNGVNDFGKSPYRKYSWSDMGYEAVRSIILNIQLKGINNFKLEEITLCQAPTAYNKIYR